MASVSAVGCGAVLVSPGGVAPSGSVDGSEAVAMGVPQA